jgi:hypothetical protein
MKYRLKALGWHFLASTFLLLMIIGTLYLGWYRWPGWYLAGMLKVVPITVGVDAALGPLLTFIIASPSKPLRTLARDIAAIAVVQLVALGYGSMTMWQGRPLYYAYSVNQITVIQALELDPAQIALSQQQNPDWAPHWYSLPRWAYVPDDAKTNTAVAQSGIYAFDMPRYYQPWQNGVAALRKRLQKVDDSTFFAKKDKTVLKQRMAERGIPVDTPTTMPVTGRGTPLLAVFDLRTMEMKELLSAKP